MTFVSYAQNYEDLVLYRALRDVERGFYVDVGAADPSERSVTRAFYDRGWSGINLEPYEPFFQRLQAERSRDINLRVVVAERPGVVQLFAVADSELSTIDPDLADRYRNEGRDVQLISVPALTLTDVCNACGDIHFLKIDAEGAETQVLAGADLSRIRPWIILVEATEPGSPASTRHKWEDLLIGRGYRFAYFDGLNAFYVAEERAALTERLAIPPNVFDDFVRTDDLRRREALAEAERQATNTASQLADAEVHLTNAESRLADMSECLANAECRLADKREDLANAESRLADMSERLANAESRLADMREDLANTESRLADMSERLADTEERAAQTSGRLADAEQSLFDTKRALGETEAHIAMSEAALADVRAQLVTSTAEQREARAQTLQLAAERARESERADHYERQLQAVHISHSWRITAPIRAASVFLRRNVVPRLGERVAHLALPAPAQIGLLPAPSMHSASQLQDGHAVGEAFGDRLAHFALPVPAPLDGQPAPPLHAAPVQGKGVQGEALTLGADFGVREADWTAWLERAAKPSQRPRPAHDWLLVCGARSEDDLQSVSADIGISEMRIVGDSAVNGAAALQALVASAAPGDCIAVIRAGDRPGSALRRALAAFARSEADIGVFDAHFVQEGRAYPLLHPGFNPPYLAASDLAASRFLLRVGGAREALSGSLRGDATVALRAVLSQRRVQGLHIAEPAIRVAESRASLADDRLRLIAPRPRAVVPEGFAVTVVICTHSKGHLLRQLLRHLEGCPEIVELVLVSHNVTNPHALETIRAAAADPRVRVINIDGPFNFARMGNLAARGARGTHLLFLNDDIVPVSGDWLGQLLHPFIDEKVGATGALLLYPDESIQHAGMFLGFDNLAGHTLRAARLPDGDYMSMSAAPRAVSCLTGAVLAVERNLFEDLNGFDPMLGTMLQDVDLCLRIMRSGRMLLFNPRAVLLHLESTTLRPMLGDCEVNRTRAREQEYFRNRWLATVQTDSFHNPTFHCAGDESLHILRSFPGDASR